MDAAVNAVFSDREMMTAKPWRSSASHRRLHTTFRRPPVRATRSQ
jgi:hypothetical protein